MVKGSPWIALAALNQPHIPNAEGVCERFEKTFAEGDQATVLSQTEGGATLKLGSATANFTLVDKPIPWERLEGPCATAWYWPEAEQQMRAHQANLIVTLLDEARDPIETAMRMTRLVAAIALESGAIGVVWGPSGQVHRTEDFVSMAAHMQRDDLPLHLWVDFRVTQRPDEEGFALFTTGLQALGHSEFEAQQFHGEPHHLAGAVYNVTHYVLEKGPVLKDGEAVGLPDGGQVNVSLGPSMIDPDQEVILLGFE